MGNQKPHLRIPRPRHAVQRPHPVIRRPPFGWPKAQPIPAAPPAASRPLPGRAPGWPGGGGGKGGRKGSKVRKAAKKLYIFLNVIQTSQTPYTAAATGTVLGTKSEENAKSSTFWEFPAFGPPRTLIFFDQVHHFCTGVRKVVKSRFLQLFLIFVISSPPRAHFPGASTWKYAKYKIVNFFEKIFSPRL